jgi:hypothetical protein
VDHKSLTSGAVFGKIACLSARRAGWEIAQEAQIVAKTLILQEEAILP